MRRNLPILIASAAVTAVMGPTFARARQQTQPAEQPMHRRQGPVRIVGHSLQDGGGAFLGLGVSYFSALWRFRNDRARLESDLAFLSRQGFNYYRMLSMVGWNASWEGREIAPVTFKSRGGRRIEAWRDYWRQLRQLVDLAYDRFGMRTQITIFADAQLMPRKKDRIEHMRRILADVVAGREQKIILLEVANEAWQNGFPGSQGTADLREFTRYLADRTSVPVATTSHHEGSFAELYANSAADIATWHFSRDLRTDDGWKPVYDCWEIGDLPGMPPVSSNEPIGPGASVASQTDSMRLVMAAAFAFAAKLPMYVFHSEAGVIGRTRFEDTPGIGLYRRLGYLLPGDLPNWARTDAKQPGALFIIYAGGVSNTTWPELPSSGDGCVRMVSARKADDFVCAAIGIRHGGLTIRAREPVSFRTINPLSGKTTSTIRMRSGERRTLPGGSGAWILIGRVLR